MKNDVVLSYLTYNDCKCFDFGLDMEKFSYKNIDD